MYSGYTKQRVGIAYNILHFLSTASKESWEVTVVKCLPYISSTQNCRSNRASPDVRAIFLWTKPIRDVDKPRTKSILVNCIIAELEQQLSSRTTFYMIAYDITLSA